MATIEKRQYRDHKVTGKIIIRYKAKIRLKAFPMVCQSAIERSHHGFLPQSLGDFDILTILLSGEYYFL